MTEGFAGDEIVYVSAGDGTTSEGEFWESLNTACNLQLPIVYLIEDNGYAISVPVEVNTAGGSISKLVAGFPGLLIQEVDGCDLLASYEVMKKAVEHVRAGKGPAFVHAQVIRPYSHSLSDDEVLYRPPEERDADAARDPLNTFPAWLVRQGHATEAGPRDASAPRSTRSSWPRPTTRSRSEQPGRGDDPVRRLLARRRPDERAVRYRGRPAVLG